MKMLTTGLDRVDLSSKTKRRKAAAMVAAFLERIRAAEEDYMGRIPENLKGSEAYENADYSIGLLDEAIDAVNAVYD